jgi:predicted ATP-dependent endonuclease of OLD family
MAHITEFTVEGLAGRDESYSQKLDRNVNVFFGLNGSGKTSLLKILNSAMNDEVESLSQIPFKRAQIKIFSLDRDKTYTYRYEKPNDSEAEEDEFNEFEMLEKEVEAFQAAENRRSSWIVDPPPELRASNWQHSYLSVTRLYFPNLHNRPIRASTTYDELQRAAEAGLEQSFGELINRLWSAYSADIFGTVQRAQAKGLADILIDILTGRSDRDVRQLEPGEVYSRVSSFLARQGTTESLGDAAVFGENYRSNSQLRSVAADISSVEVHIQNAMAPRDKLRALIQQMFSGNKTITFGDSAIDVRGSKNEKIGLPHLSSGEKQLIRIFVETLMVGPSSLLVDEPELSMHVDWQRQLIAAMRQLNPEAQIIAATHSPEIMADIPDKNIFRL